MPRSARRVVICSVFSLALPLPLTMSLTSCRGWCHVTACRVDPPCIAPPPPCIA